MERKVFRTNKVVDFPAFSQAIIAGDLIFLSGMCAIPVESGIKKMADHKLENIPIKPMSFAEQVENILNSIKTILEEAGSSMENVVRCNVYLADMDKYDEMSQIYARYFPKNPPARCTVEVSRLVLDLPIEIEVTAVIPSRGRG